MARETSDEKLLKLIEGSKRITPQAQVGIRPKGKNIFALAGRLNLAGALKKRINLYSLNKALIVFAGMLTLYFLYSLVTGAIIYGDVPLPQARAGSSIAKLVSQEPGKYLTSQEYLKISRQRNVFLPPEAKAAVEGPAPDIAAFIKDFKVVGIIWSANPEAIVESTKEGRTYLLKKGDSFGQASYKVKEVRQNSVLVEIPAEEGTKEYELR